VSRLLLIGYHAEGTFSHFRDFAIGAGAEPEVLDLATLRDARDLTMTESPGELVVSIDDDVYTLSEYSAIYSRAFWFELGSPARNRALAALIGAFQGFLEHTPAIVANRPSAGASNVNKLAHLAVLREAGLTTFPEAFIFGDAALARTIVAPDGNWISKSCSSVKTKSAALDAALYARLDRLVVCPSLFQRRIRGADVRVHVVGDVCIAEKIVSQQVDYRYREPGAERAQFSPCEVPPEIAKACVAYCARQRLVFAGVDFKVSDADGKWYVLEANPMPGYEPYDRRLDRRISHALLAHLTKKPEAVVDVEPFIVAARRPVPSPF
jgi:hypothetical protein